MKRRNFLAFAMSAAVVFASCNKNEPGGEIPGAGDNSGEGFVTVSLTNASSSFTAKSVAPGAPDEGTASERTIKKLEFYVFNSNGQLDSKASYVPFDFASNEKYTFSVTAGSKTILVAANMNLGPIDGNLSAVRAKIFETAIPDPLEVPATGIPMAGETTNILASEGNAVPVSIAVSRLYAKMTAPTTVNTVVNLDAKQMDSLITLWNDQPLVGNGVNFNLTGFVVVNGLQKSYAFANYGTTGEDNRWDPAVWQLGNDPDNYHTSVYQNGQLGNVYSGSEFLTGESVYLYENSPLRTTTTLTGYDARTLYAFIVEADLVDNGNPANSVTRYWRININKSDDPATLYKILRNAIYNVNILNVRTLGHNTPEEAEKEKPVIPDLDEAAVEVKVTPAPWRVFNENSDI